MNRKSNLLQDIKAVVWDYDGVHYPYAALPDWRSFDHIRLEVVRRYLPDFSDQQIIDIAAEGYARYGDNVQSFYAWAKKNGRDAEKIRQGIFRDYHRDLFNYVAQEHSGIITAHQPTIEAFKECSHIVQHGLVTHSSLEEWALPLLAEQKLLNFFNPAAMFGLDDVDYNTKVETVVGLERAMMALNLKPHQILFAEDSMPNIVFAHTNLPGLKTAFIHQGKPLVTLPPHVTMQMHNPLAVMQAIAGAHRL